MHHIWTYENLEPLAIKINNSGRGLIDYSALAQLAEELNNSRHIHYKEYVDRIQEEQDKKKLPEAKSKI